VIGGDVNIFLVKKPIPARIKTAKNRVKIKKA